MVWKDFTVYLKHFSPDLFYQHFSLTCLFVSVKVCFTLRSPFVFCADEQHMRFHSSFIVMLLFEEKHLMCSKKKKMLFLQFSKTCWWLIGKQGKNIIFPALLIPIQSQILLPRRCKPLLVGGAGSSIVQHIYQTLAILAIISTLNFHLNLNPITNPSSEFSVISKVRAGPMFCLAKIFW